MEQTAMSECGLAGYCNPDRKRETTLCVCEQEKGQVSAYQLMEQKRTKLEKCPSEISNEAIAVGKKDNEIQYKNFNFVFKII